MGIAHFGVGLAIKPKAEKIPLWVLLVVSEFLDILSMLFLATGIERMSTTKMSFSHGIQYIETGSVPWSHGLFMSVIWSLLGVGIGYLITKEWREGWVLGLVVFSHWGLDLIVHLPDLPIFFEGSPTLGLGLWGGQAGFTLSMILEFVLFAGGLLIYLRWRMHQRRPGMESVS